MSDTAPNDEALEVIREELPGIAAHLDELSREAIPMLKRALENMQASGDDRGVANTIIRTLPYLAEKCEKITVALESTMPVNLNITIGNEQGHYTLEDAVSLYRNASNLPHNTATTSADQIDALIAFYEALTGENVKPSTRIKDVKNVTHVIRQRLTKSD